MNRVLYAKLLYAIYSPFQNLKLKWNGVKTNGLVFTGGSLFVSRAKNSTISIGRGCRFMSKECGNLIGLNHRCMLSTVDSAKLVIGDRCSFSGVALRCFGDITLGDNVRVGANTTIISGDAHQDDPRAGKDKPINIEDNVWIGSNVMILKGVTIGRNSVVGAGSIVTKSIPENVVAAGNPCKVIKSLNEETIKRLEGK